MIQLHIVQLQSLDPVSQASQAYYGTGSLTLQGYKCGLYFNALTMIQLLTIQLQSLNPASQASQAPTLSVVTSCTDTSLGCASMVCP